MEGSATSNVGYPICAANMPINIVTGGGDVHTIAKDILSLDDKQADELFLPRKESNAYEATLDEGILMLEGLRDNGITDWSTLCLPVRTVDDADEEVSDSHYEEYYS